MMQHSTSSSFIDPKTEARLAAMLSYLPEELEKFLDIIDVKKVEVSSRAIKNILAFASAYEVVNSSTGTIEMIKN